MVTTSEHLTTETNVRFRVTMLSGRTFVVRLGELIYAKWGDRIVCIDKVGEVELGCYTADAIRAGMNIDGSE